MNYILCELNDENYTMPGFSFHKNFISAQNEAIESIVEVFKNSEGFDFNIETTEPNLAYDKGRKIIRIDGTWKTCNFNCNEEHQFYVTEIMKIDISKGNYLLIYHHAYEGVDFHIEYQGTYEECFEEKKKQMIEMDKDLCSLSDGIDENFNPEEDNCIDDGNEWHYWSIVEIQLD